jgi:ferredoxin
LPVWGPRLKRDPLDELFFFLQAVFGIPSVEEPHSFDHVGLGTTGPERRIAMRIHVDALKCIGCMACEMACGYHRDDAFALLASCIVVYRAREKKNYFGIVIKEEESLTIARPEGIETKKIGVAEEPGDSGEKKEADASAKPMLLREPCDLCADMKYGPMCVKICPVNAISPAEGGE